MSDIYQNYVFPNQLSFLNNKKNSRNKKEILYSDIFTNI